MKKQLYKPPKEASYSKIIEPDVYNRIITEEHLYIAAADNYLAKAVEKRIQSYIKAEVVELGCGPARVLPIVGKIQNINLTGIDHDAEFIKYAKKIIAGTPIKVLFADIETYQHSKPVMIFYSQGVHHHIPKGKHTDSYLSNIYKQLSPGGYYIVSDEFIPDYETIEKREIYLIVWYAHIISHALKNGYIFLAYEEAKTLLDDLYEARDEITYKTSEQLDLVIESVEAINDAAESKFLGKAHSLASDLTKKLNALEKDNPSGDARFDLSRRDYKVCDKVFREEVEGVGFVLEEVKSFGPIKNIGGMSVYVLKKNK